MTRVLIVEDEESFADPLAFLLRKEGFTTALAATGQDALEEFDRNGADIVLLDLMLPGMSGTDVCKALRTRSAVPVIMVTARDSEIDKVVGLELGADDYIAKPFSPRELVARVRGILRRANKPNAAVAVSVAAAPTPPVLVDEGRRQIRFYGRALELSRYEFGLLQTLASRPGHVFSRDALLDRVWGDATESLDRTVDAHVKTLRAKMKLVAPALEPIRTHRGSGYALAEDLPAALPSPA